MENRVPKHAVQIDKTDDHTTARVCLTVLFALLILSLIPVLYIGRYDRMFADDFGQGLLTHQALLAGEGILGVLKAAWRTMTVYYREWQGTYSALLLFALNPGIGDPQAYALTPYILIGSLTASLGYFWNRICFLVIKASRRVWLFTWGFSLFLCIQFVKSPLKAFYWYNGAIFYLFYFALMLVLIGLLLDCVLRPFKTDHSGAARRPWGRTFLLILLAVFLAGGSYPVILVTACLFAACVLWTWIGRRQARWTVTAGFLLYLLGFAVSAAAPGNAMRASLYEGAGAWEAIFNALLRTPAFLGSRVLKQYGIFMLLLLIWLPFCWYLQRKPVFQYRLPWLTLAPTWLLPAIMITPPYFATGIGILPNRIWNIVYFAFYILLMIDVFYWVGWIRCRHEKLYGGVLAWMQKRKRLAGAYIAACMIGTLLISTWGPSFVQEKVQPTCAVAVSELLDGTAKRYAAEWDEDYAAIIASDDARVIMEPILVTSELLPPSGFGYGVEWWKLNEYFDKEYVGPVE